MWHLDWRFLPVFDPTNASTEYVGAYNPTLVAISVIIAILAAYVALSISGRIAAAQTSLSRRAWTSAGAVVMGGGIWAMHFIAMLAFSLPCGIGYNPIGTLLSAVPAMLASGVALSVISQTQQPSLVRLSIGAVLMGAGIGTMHYSGMAAMEPEALLRYNPFWAAVSVVTAIVLAFISLSIRFRFRGSGSATAPTMIAAAVMGFGVSGMHYAAMHAAVFFPILNAPNLQMALPPVTLAVVITVFTVLVASMTLVASFAGRQVELALSLRAEIAERERNQKELIHARHQAEDANAAKSQFLATMSHEIRTPLNGVIGLANLLTSTPLNSRQGHMVDNLARSGRTLLALINDILDLSRIEAHELALFEAPFEIREVIAEVTDLFGDQCATKGLELVCSIAEDVPTQLLGDSVRLRQILINLVGNAIKFTERGEIFVEVAVAKPQGDELILSFAVTDTGIGIASDKLGQVFEPFRQADASMTRSHGGSGLGLAITKHLVELMGGTIGVESEVASGSRFHFSARFHRVAGTAKTSESERKLARPLRVLLVDSNTLSARVMVQYLSAWNAEPTVVNTARDARTTWQDATKAGSPFEAAIVDVKGLGADGIELARSIRNQANSTRAEVILLVGMNNLARDNDIETLGAFAILTKPARPSALFNGLATIAAGGTKGHASLVTRRNARAAIPRFEARVLVVEDNPVNQAVAVGVLENMDCRVTTAANGRQAVDLFNRDTFDLVLMDCEMPIMDGFEATRHMRTTEFERNSSAHTPIVALTAHALAEIREKCLHSGMDDFLVKPFDELQIGDMLRRWIPSQERAPRKRLTTPTDMPETETTDGTVVIDLGAINKIRAIQGKSNGALFGRVVSQFTVTAPQLVAAIRSSSDDDDGEALWRAAHSLKSSAAALGAKRLSNRCAQIEAVARERGGRAVHDLLDALEMDLANARDGLRNLIGAEHV